MPQRRIILEFKISIFSQYVIISNSIRLYVISRVYKFLYKLYVKKRFFFLHVLYFVCNSLLKVNFCTVHIELCTCVMTLVNTLNFLHTFAILESINRFSLRNKKCSIPLNSEYHAANVSVSVCYVGYCKRPRDVSHKNMR